MDELIETINQLQDVFAATGSHGLDLPQIVVVGTQSSGKSSVLEHVVGKSFLPRGAGVVTRCPLVLQLVHAQGKLMSEDYAIFQHNKTKVFTDYHLITKEIEEQTERLAGGNKGICHHPITLKIFSTSFSNLTLVDLPGLTKVPVGDQPSDIEQQTKQLTLNYIESPNSIILAVIPANADMATSESLKIAREVDPDGRRTLAVVTKLDLMDEGTDGKDMLSGKIIPVKLGIIGVVNRSQRGIMESKSIKQSLKDEAAFFYKNYKNVATFHGSPYLIKTVQAILITHIKDCLPKLREKVHQKLQSQRAELHKLGDIILDRPALLLDLMTKFSSTYCSAIKGNLDNIQTNELYGGARVNYVFQESLSIALQSIDPLTGLSKNAILTAIQNASGTSPALFVPEVAFELLVKRQIKRLRSPCLQCVDLIHEELTRIVRNCVDDQDLQLQRFPKLQQEIGGVTIDLLRSRIPITSQMVNYFIDIQLAYINTAHPDFLPNCGKSLSLSFLSESRNVQNESSASRRTTLPMMRLSEDNLPVAIEHQAHPQGDQLPPEKGSQDCIVIQDLIRSYFFIVRKTIQDIVPKVVMHFLVNFVMDHIQSELVARLYKNDASDLLQESQALSNKRKDIKTTITTLEQANTILNTLKPPVHISKSSPSVRKCLPATPFVSTVQF